MSNVAIITDTISCLPEEKFEEYDIGVVPITMTINGRDYRDRVDITPDHLQQRHVFHFEIDQSYLPGLIRQCDRIVRDHPPRGARHRQ